MRTLLELAYCQGVLVIGAAGNGNTTSQAPVLPAALETEGSMPDKRRCQTEFGVANPKLPAKGYAPLIHSVGSVDLYDERLPTVRAWAHPRIAAYGMAVTVPGPNGEYFSASQRHVDVSGGGQRHRSRRLATQFRPRRCAGHDGRVQGRRRAGDKEQGEPNGDLQRQYERTIGVMAGTAVRATLCGALQKMPGGPAGVTCVTPDHPKRDDPKTGDLLPAADRRRIAEAARTQCAMRHHELRRSAGSEPRAGARRRGSLGRRHLRHVQTLRERRKRHVDRQPELQRRAARPVLYDRRPVRLELVPSLLPTVSMDEQPERVVLAGTAVGLHPRRHRGGNRLDVLRGQACGGPTERHCRYRRDDPTAAAGVSACSLLAMVVELERVLELGPRDATAPDVVQDAGAPDVRQDVGAPDAGPR